MLENRGSSSSVFGGTSRRAEHLNKLYSDWKRLPDAFKHNVSVVSLLGGLSYRATREEYIPQMDTMRMLEDAGVDPTSLCKNPEMFSDLPMIENAPKTRTVRLGTHIKEIPIKDDTSAQKEESKPLPESETKDQKEDSDICPEPHEPVKKAYRSMKKSKTMKELSKKGAKV